MAKEILIENLRYKRTKKEKTNLFDAFNRWLNNIPKYQFFSIILILLIISGVGLKNIMASEENPNGVKIPFLSSSKTECTNILDPNCWKENFAPELKSSDNLTNALLIGLDTRDGEEGLMNTDTIILASYDHNTGKTLLISFPRDLYVNYKISNSNYNTKINSIYSIGEQNSKMDGMTLLKENIEEWLDIEIQYTAKVNFHTVTDLVTAVGGIDIELKEDYLDIYPKKELSPELEKDCKRASDQPLYCIFEFKKGINTLDGEHALIYSRMRQYSSDFDRARRQQEVINAVKNKVMGSQESTVDKAKFIWNIYQALMNKNNIESNVEYTDMMAGLFLLDKADTEPIKIVLDPNFGGVNKYMFGTQIGQDEEGNGGIYVIKIYDESFKSIRSEITRIRQNPDLYNDLADVVIVNKTGEKFLKDSKALLLKEEKPYLGSLNYVTDTKTDSVGTKIYVYDETKKNTIDYLVKYFGLTEADVIHEPELLEIKQSGFKEDIKVIVNSEF